jgi:ABC-type polysaccharide/polyol phosphate export permease
MPDPFSFSEFLSILFYLIFYLGLFGNCIITLSIYVQRGFTFLFLSFIFLQLLFVSSNILFEQQIYSQMMNMIFFNNPFNMLLYDLRYLIFFGETSFIWVAISIALSLLWVFLNSLFLKNKLNQ